MIEAKEGTTFRTWNLNKIQAPIDEPTRPTEEELSLDDCCMPRKVKS
jgi:hypothetical protein